MQSVTSQEDTVRIPLKTANAIINDLEELDSLRIESRLNGLLLSLYKQKEESYQSTLYNKDNQIELLKSNYNIITETHKKSFLDKLLNTFKDIGIGVGIFAIGFLVGSL